MRVFPPDVVDEVIAGCDRTEQRSRSLLARVMAYFAMGMALLPNAPSRLGPPSPDFRTERG